MSQSNKNVFNETKVKGDVCSKPQLLTCCMLLLSLFYLFIYIIYSVIIPYFFVESPPQGGQGQQATMGLAVSLWRT